MKPDKNGEPAAICGELVAALEAQVEKQDQIIRIQEETIQALTEHNEKLMAFIDRLSRH